MNKNFDRFLAMLESKASTPERKADLRAARELYRTGTLTEGWTTLQGVSNWGKQKLGNLFGAGGKDSTKYGNATKAPEIKERDDAKAARIREVDDNLSKASKLVVDAAEWNPGQVDAWVDCRLKPAIQRSLEQEGGFLTPEEKKKAFKAEKSHFEEIYRNADKSDVRVWKDKMKDSLKKADEEEAYRKEEEQTKADEEQYRKERELAAKAQEKRDALDKYSTEHTAQDPVNGTGLDSNTRAATARSEDFNKAEADRKATAPKDGEPSMSGSEADDAYQKMMDFFGEAVSAKKLRAAFESVYGDSSEYSENDIRTICESCYRRSRK